MYIVIVFVPYNNCFPPPPQIFALDPCGIVLNTIINKFFEGFL